MSDSKELHIEEKISYWKDLWHDSVQNFLKRSFGLELLTPHVLIDNIILELEADSLQNQNNKKFFYRTINNFLEKDEIIKTDFKNDFILLRREFNKDRKGYLLTICKNIQQKFRSGEYFDRSLIEIEKLILSNSPITNDLLFKLTYITQSIMVEFLLKSYALDEIVKFLDNLFSGVTKLKDGKFYTKYPCKTDIRKYKNLVGEIDWISYGNALDIEIGALTIKDRINALKRYYYPTIDSAHYIFVIKGLKGNQTINIGDVTFYSLESKRFIKTEEKHNWEYEDLQLGEEREKYMQVAVKVKFLTEKSSLSTAIEKIENCVDLIYTFYGVKTNIEVLTNKYIIVKNGEYYHSSYNIGENNHLKNHIDSLDIDYNKTHFRKLSKYKEILKTNTSLAKKIRNAMHWIRKGDSAMNNDDKLIFFWIALENLIPNTIELKLDLTGNRNATKFDLINSLVIANQLVIFTYDYGWDLFHYYESNECKLLVKSKFPEALLKKANLKSRNKKFYLKKFIKCLPEFKEYEDNPYLIDKIDTLTSFYQDPSETLSTLTNKKQSIEDDITMIYRFRNLIVHSATFEKTLLPFYTWKIRTYTRDLVRQIIWSYNNEANMEDVMLQILLKKEKYLERLKSNGTIFPDKL